LLLPSLLLESAMCCLVFHVVLPGAHVKGSCYHLWHITAMAAQLAGVQVTKRLIEGAVQVLA
jgi:hypothetical protein